MNPILKEMHKTEKLLKYCFEVIDKKGKLHYVLNLDETNNIDITKKATGRTIINWR